MAYRLRLIFWNGKTIRVVEGRDRQIQFYRKSPIDHGNVVQWFRRSNGNAKDEIGTVVKRKCKIDRSAGRVAVLVKFPLIGEFGFLRLHVRQKTYETGTGNLLDCRLSGSWNQLRIEACPNTMYSQI